MEGSLCIVAFVALGSLCIVAFVALGSLCTVALVPLGSLCIVALVPFARYPQQARLIYRLLCSRHLSGVEYSGIASRKENRLDILMAEYDSPPPPSPRSQREINVALDLLI